jgi:hypothetical protein
VFSGISTGNANADSSGRTMIAGPRIALDAPLIVTLTEVEAVVTDLF